MPITGTHINPNRAVAVLTPLVFAPLAGAITAGVAKYGVDIDGGQLQAIFIAGSTIALAKAALWTKGWQSFEQRQDAHASDALALAGHDDDLTVELGEDDDLGAELGDEDHDVVAEEDDELDDDELDDEDMDEDLDAEAAELFAAQGS